MAKKDESQGAALLKAVERIVDSPAKIQARVDETVEWARGKLPDDASSDEIRGSVERQLISHYSNRTAIAGGASALPGLVPGLGSVTALVGGGLLDMTLCLKYEVEMVLALASLRGYDIEDARERQLAYLLAAAHTYEATGGRNPLPDLVKTEIDAVWHYTPRQLAKLVGSMFVRLALMLAGRGLTRAIPFVGMVVSSAANKTLTSRVGKSIIKALDQRAAARKGKAESKPKPARAARKGAKVKRRA